MFSEVKAGYFTTVVYSDLLNIGKSVLTMMDTLWENSLLIAKDVLIIHVNFIIIAVAFSEKKWRQYFCTAPCNV
jgi:hypothetical protein